MCADKSWEVQQGVIGNECCELAPATRGWQVGGGIRRLCLALFAGTLSGRPDVRMVRMSKAEIYKDFDSFMQDGVTPKRKQNDIRLDGKTKGSSRKVFGYFRYNKQTWKVHEDTHYIPLDIAYEDRNSGEVPFVELPTATGKGLRLALSGKLREVQQERQQSRYEYLYIYSK